MVLSYHFLFTQEESQEGHEILFMTAKSNSEVSGESLPAEYSQADTLWKRQLIRVGHGGASGIAPANSLKSLATAIEIGVDMVEFDVRPCLDDLVLLHDDKVFEESGGVRLASQSAIEILRTLDVVGGEPIATLEEALDLVKGKVLMNIDLKTKGFEADLVRTLKRMGMGAEVLISSLDANSLSKVRELAPGLKTAISYPKDSGNASTRTTLKPVVLTLLKLLRFTLQYQIISKIEAAQADVAMLHFGVISPETVRKVHEAKGLVFAWTVDDLATLRYVKSMGVDGIASNYPELFKELE